MTDMSTADLQVGTISEYDSELGKITDQDREYADDACRDLGFSPNAGNIKTISEWFRKVRYEAVMADRRQHSR